MLDNPPDDLKIANPKTLWQSQKNEETRMTLELLHQRIRDLSAKRRRELFVTVFVAAIVLALSTWGFPRSHSVALQIVFVFASAWALAGLYFVKRGLRNAELLDDSTLQTGIEFYRLQIQQNMALFNRILPWTLGPVILAVFALIPVLAGMAQNQPLNKIAPFCVLYVLWLIALPLARLYKRRELHRELDLLNSLERGK